MPFVSWPRLLGAVAALSVGAAFAAEPAAVAVAPGHEAGLKQVQERKAVAYRDVLAAFDAAQLAAPNDAALAVERCRFIAQFTDEEYGEWVESAPDDFEACNAALEKRWPKAPVVRLFALESLWGEEAITAGETLLEDADRWPRALRRQLLTQLSNAYSGEDNAVRAGALAVEAVGLGEASLAAEAVEHLVSIGKLDEAAKLLRGVPPDQESWRAQSRVEAALALRDRKAALAELRRHAGVADEIDTAVAARAHLHAGDIAGARKLLQADEDDSDDDLQAVRFDAALAANDFDGAARLVDMGNVEAFPGSAARFTRLALSSPTSLLSPQMLLGVFVCLFVLAALALLPGLLVAPVHYRGLARRVQGKATTPLFPDVGLRRAWFAGAVVFCVPLVAGMLVDPDAMATMLDGEVPEAAALFDVMFWGTVAGLLCILPGLRGMDRRQLLGNRDTLRGSWRIVASWALVLAVGMLLALWHANTGGHTETVQTRTMDALATGGVTAHGAAITLLLMAVLVPVFEEIAFRGLLLGGMTKYISFGWANVLQALLFAASHDDPPRYPYYFVLGLLAGWLVRRTGALSPAIGLHMLNNLFAFAMRM